MMKNIPSIQILKKILVPALLLLVISSCYYYPEIDEFSYSEYRRVIGPEGGTINFYRNYETDSIDDLAVKMEFPENAVDSLIVFNMYEFWDEVTYYDLIFNLYTETFSDFLYFVPFYESEGYREVLNDSSDFDSLTQKHTSIYFNNPVTVTYYDSFDETIPDSAKLYRIKIPAEDEWVNEEDDNNVWVVFNEQGYPDGYDAIDLIYLINGRWTEFDDWGLGELSLDNWEEVDGFIYDPVMQTVQFDIWDTDYMYVMATDAFGKK